MRYNREELAWAAGFFDGEGTTSVDVRKGYQAAKMTLVQCHPGVLERFKEAVGGLGNITGPYTRGLPKQAPFWRYAVTKHEHAQQVLACLFPFLGGVKRDQAKAAFERHNSQPRKYLPRHPNGTHCCRGHEFTPENTYVYGARRACKACHRERNRKWRSRGSS